MTLRDPQGSGSRAAGPGDRPLRLNRYLALCGVASRRAAMEIVFAGRVKLNGQAVRDPGLVVRCGEDRVELDGEIVQPPRRWLYYAYHKPRGIIVTRQDERGRAALQEVLRRIRQHVFPVGRLDRGSEGLLLLTNHGELAEALLHPRFGIEKLYRVRVTPRPSALQLARLAGGVALGGGEHSRPVQVRLKRRASQAGVLTIVLREGKKREVRRMCAAVGLRVRRLRRLSFAGIRLDALPPGAVRPLTPEEVAHLAGLTGLAL